MRVNRQLYEEASYITYNRVFNIHILSYGYCFLNRHYFQDLSFLTFPFHKAKHIHLQISVPKIKGQDANENAENIFQLRRSISEITWLISEFTLREIVVEFVHRDPWPIFNDKLLHSAELAVSDFEMLLQPFRLIRNEKCEILITPITDGPRSQYARSTAKEKMHPDIYELIRGCEDAMTNPEYCDSGDFERLQWTTWYYQQRWQGYDWTPQKYRAIGWEYMSGDRI